MDKHETAAQGSLTRRMFVLSALSLPLAGCQDSEKVAVRFKVIARVLYQGQEYQASTVMECRYVRVKNSLVGIEGRAYLYGEALIFDLPNGKSFFILPYWVNNNGGFSEAYQRGVVTTFGIKNSLGSLSNEDLARMKAFSGRRPFNFFGHLPAFVSFRDEANPKTIFEIDPHNMEATLPEVRFAGLDIEITNEPVTEKLRERLPWLNSRQQVFDRDPPGHQRPDHETPIGYKIVNSHFFG